MDGEPEASEGEWGGRNGRHRENVDEHHRVIHIHLHRLEFKWKSLLSTTNFRTHERGFLVSTNLLGGPLPKLVPGRTRTGVVPQSHIGLYYVLKRTCPGGFGLAHGRRPSLVVDKRKTIICNDRLERLPHRHQTHLHRWWWWVSFRGGRVIVSPPSPASSTAHVCCFQSKQWLPLIWMNDKCISSHQTNWTHRSPPSIVSLHRFTSSSIIRGSTMYSQIPWNFLRLSGSLECTAVYNYYFCNCHSSASLQIHRVEFRLLLLATATQDGIRYPCRRSSAP